MPTAVAAIADVPLPNRIPFAANVLAPVPPWATLKSVVSPVILVMSLLAPSAAAPKAALASLALLLPVPPWRNWE